MGYIPTYYEYFSIPNQPILYSVKTFRNEMRDIPKTV